jgi:hypothetical protein
VGTVVLGVILILVGGQCVLRETLAIDLPPLDADRAVPVLAFIAGLLLVYRAWRDRTEGAAGGRQGYSR